MKIRSTFVDPDAAIRGYSQSGRPSTSETFFPGKPVLPARPIMRAAIIPSVYWLDQSVLSKSVHQIGACLDFHEVAGFTRIRTHVRSDLDIGKL